jgi:hypothetical protein
VDEGRYLAYQPLHGLGVEAVVFDLARRLAMLSGRLLICPRLPELETQIYRGSFDTYFEIPGDGWLPCEKGLAFQPRLDLLLKIIPWYRKEFRAQRNRNLHPVWVDGITHPTYFTKIGFRVQTSHEMRLVRAPSIGRIAKLIRGSNSSAVSYLNGMRTLNRISDAEALAKRPLAPCVPKRAFLERARKEIGHPSVAVHIRRGNLVEVMRRSRGGIPSLQEFLEESRNRGPVFIASDSTDARSFMAAELKKSYALEPGADAVENAVMDIAGCCMAEMFVGTWSSTMSLLIVEARKRLGISPSTSILLHGQKKPLARGQTD